MSHPHMVFSNITGHGLNVSEEVIVQSCYTTLIWVYVIARLWYWSSDVWCVIWLWDIAPVLPPTAVHRSADGNKWPHSPPYREAVTAPSLASPPRRTYQLECIAARNERLGTAGLRRVGWRRAGVGTQFRVRRRQANFPSVTPDCLCGTAKQHLMDCKK